MSESQLESKIQCLLIVKAERCYINNKSTIRLINDFIVYDIMLIVNAALKYVSGKLQVFLSVLYSIWDFCICGTGRM